MVDGHVTEIVFALVCHVGSSPPPVFPSISAANTLMVVPLVWLYKLLQLSQTDAVLVT